MARSAKAETQQAAKSVRRNIFFAISLITLKFLKKTPAQLIRPIGREVG
jgi:hypothetical protein